MLIAVPAMPLKKSRLSIGSSLSVALANIFHAGPMRSLVRGSRYRAHPVKSQEGH